MSTLTSNAPTAPLESREDFEDDRSLPRRQLRNYKAILTLSGYCSLPRRQLRKCSSLCLLSFQRSLPRRQLRKEIDT